MSEPLRVALDARRAAWMPHTGIGRYVGELLRHAHRERRIRYVGLLAAGQLPVEGEANWLRVRPALSAPGRLTWEQIVQPYAVRRSAADVLHLPWHEGSPRPGVPLVLTVQDLAALSTTAQRSRTFAYYRWLLRTLAPRAHRVIVPSNSTAADLDRLGVARGRLRVIPYGHDARLVGARARGPRLGETQAVLYCGGYGPRKRLDVLLESMKTVVASRPEAQLVLVGSVPADVREHVARLALEGHVHMPGRVTDDSLRALYGNADACVYPSEHEGFGFPALDALTAGVPLVACDASSVPEIAGGIGWLVPPGDPGAFAEALVEVLDAGPTVSARVEQGSLRAQGFSWSACIVAHADVYLEAASR